MVYKSFFKTELLINDMNTSICVLVSLTFVPNVF